MKISLGGFTRSSIEAQLGSDLAASIELALRQYARRLRSSQPPPRFPRFRCDDPVEGPEVELDLFVDPEVERILEREVEGFERDAQGVGAATSAGRLAVHAVLVYLAELDRSDVEVLPTPARS